MGLDMYLYAERYLSEMDKEQFEELKRVVESQVMATPLKEDSSLPWSGSLTIRQEVAYWRKANAIHSWFVENVQDGTDDCRLAYVSADQLEELVADCSQVLSLMNPFCREAYDSDEWDNATEIPSHVKAEVEELLMPTDGFFFGSTEIDLYFYHTVRYTHDRLTEVLEWLRTESEDNRFWEIYYRSSW